MEPILSEPDRDHLLTGKLRRPCVTAVRDVEAVYPIAGLFSAAPGHSMRHGLRFGGMQMVPLSASPGQRGPHQHNSRAARLMPVSSITGRILSDFSEKNFKPLPESWNQLFASDRAAAAAEGYPAFNHPVSPIAA